MKTRGIIAIALLTVVSGMGSIHGPGTASRSSAQKGECDDDRFLLTFNRGMLGPSLSRSSLQTRRFKHNMQRMHLRFC
jgi:hypothetical protein